MPGALYAVVIRLADGSVEPVEPEVVVGGLVRLGEAWELSVTRFHGVFDPLWTHCWRN